MKNSEFEEIFAPLDVLGDYSGNFIELFNEKIELQNKFFLKNFRKDKDLKIKVFEKFGYSYLLGNKDNLEALDKILDNPNFIKLFEKSDLYLDGICKIVLIYSSSSRYFVENSEIEQKKYAKKLKKLEKNYTNLKSDQIDLLNINDWLNQRLNIGLHLAIKNLMETNLLNSNVDVQLIKETIKNELIIFSNADALFYDYFSDAQYLVNAQNPFRLRDTNIRLNFFVRELKNTFNQTISNQIICELVSTVLDHELDETGIKNILENANTHPLNTQKIIQITKGVESNTIENFRLIDKPDL